MTTFRSWQEKTIYPLGAAVMIGSCLYAVVQAVERFAGTQVDLYIVMVVGMLAALQSFYTQGLAAKLRIGGVKKWLVNILELALLLVLARLGVFAADVLTGRNSRFDFFSLDPRWVMVILMVFLAWLFARVVAHQIGRLHLMPYTRQEMAHPDSGNTATGAGMLSPAAAMDRYQEAHKETEYIDVWWVSPYDRLKSLFLQGGIVLMLFSGFARMDLSQLRLAGPPPVHIVLNSLLYFGVGLILLAQAHFDGIRRRWYVDEVKVAPETGTRWLRYSLILISLAALLAFLVPVDYAAGLLDAMRPLVDVIIFIVRLLTGLVYLLLSLIGFLLAPLFGGEMQPPDPQNVLPQLETPPTAAPAGSGLLDWLSSLNWTSLQSMFSWLIALAVIIYVARSYLRDHANISIRLGKIGVFRFLGDLWRALLGSLVGLAEDAGELGDDLVQRLLGRLGAVRRPITRLFGLGSLPPRERIRYLYLTILNRAASQGISRKRDQTPYEYEGVLTPRVPDAEDDVEELTRAFVEARYSQQPVADGDIGPVYEAWLRLRSALRRARPGR